MITIYNEELKNKRLYELFKRILDIIISIFGIIFSFIPIIICAILIKIEDMGPIFYTQNRIGKDGKIFKIYKLRSMKVNAENNGAILSSKNDDRVTNIGKFIRDKRIDELPQFINILLGNMSFIGPRPERPEIEEEYCREFSDFKNRLFIKPGLTGYAQVNASYNIDFKEKYELDFYYIKSRNLFLDIYIIFKTIKVVLQGVQYN